MFGRLFVPVHVLERALHLVSICIATVTGTSSSMARCRGDEEAEEEEGGAGRNITDQMYPLIELLYEQVLRDINRM